MARFVSIVDTQRGMNEIPAVEVWARESCFNFTPREVRGKCWGKRTISASSIKEDLLAHVHLLHAAFVFF
jgi:hypothetical protein